LTPSPLPFEDLRAFFADDEEYGQLCDIPAPDARRAEWARFLKHVVPQYPHHFSLVTSTGEAPQPLPDDAMQVLDLANSDTGPWPSLTLDVLGMEVRVHFYDPDWLEADFWRSAITPQRYLAVAELMCRMGDAMQHDIFMTPEASDHSGVMVYEVTLRCFRRPRHGAGADGRLRTLLFAGLAEALAPIRSCAVATPPDAPRSQPALSQRELRAVLDRVEELTRPHRELVLQDELSIQDRARLTHVWSLLATIVSPPPGSSAGRNRSGYWRELLEVARREDIAGS
jgi:hypothetical protein